MIRSNIRNLLSRPDRLSGLVLMVVAAVALSQAVRLPFSSIQGPDAGLLRITLSVLLLVFAAAVILNSFKRAPQPPEFTARSVCAHRWMWICHLCSVPR
jgi:hypothetical protein